MAYAELYQAEKKEYMKAQHTQDCSNRVRDGFVQWKMGNSKEVWREMEDQLWAQHQRPDQIWKSHYNESLSSSSSLSFSVK